VLVSPAFDAINESPRASPLNVLHESQQPFDAEVLALRRALSRMREFGLSLVDDFAALFETACEQRDTRTLRALRREMEGWVRFLPIENREELLAILGAGAQAKERERHAVEQRRVLAIMARGRIRSGREREFLEEYYARATMLGSSDAIDIEQLHRLLFNA
jgi:hypothetical protein